MNEISLILERSGVYHGYYYAVVGCSMGHRCGYVRVPPDHPAHGKKYMAEDDKDVLDVDVHGGLTYSETWPEGLWEECRFPDGGTMFGFDCAHAGDVEDPSLMPGYDRDKHLAELLMKDGIDPRGVIRTSDYVERECFNFISQLEEMAKNV
jgi:hypothetical protein